MKLCRSKPVTAERQDGTGRTIGTVVTFLEMSEAPRHRESPPVNLTIALMRVEKPTVEFYRFLYAEVGRDYLWIDRAKLCDEALLEAISADGVDIFVAYADGTPAGYFELANGEDGEVWLAYFGIMPAFHGRGLGKWLLSEAIATAWSRAPKTVRVETCTLDDPRALPLYQRMGFRPYKRMNKVMEAPSP